MKKLILKFISITVVLGMHLSPVFAGENFFAKKPAVPVQGSLTITLVKSCSQVQEYLNEYCDEDYIQENGQGNCQWALYELRACAELEGIDNVRS